MEAIKCYRFVKDDLLHDPWAEVAVLKIQNDFKKFKVGRRDL